MLVGRDDVLRDAVAAVRGGRSVVLAGRPGVGRTAVLRAVAAEVGAAPPVAAMTTLRRVRFAPLSWASGRDLSTWDEADVVNLLAQDTTPFALDDLDEADGDTALVVARVAEHRPIVVTIVPGATIAAFPGATTIRLLPQQSATIIDANLPLPLRIEDDIAATAAALSPAARRDLALLAIAGEDVPEAALGAVEELRSDGLLHDRAVARAALDALDEQERLALHAAAALVVSDPVRSVDHLVAAGDEDGAVAAAIASATTEPDPSVRSRLWGIAADRTGDALHHLAAARAAVAATDASAASHHAEAALAAGGLDAESLRAAALTAAQARRLAGDELGALRMLPSDAHDNAVAAERTRLEVASSWSATAPPDDDAPASKLARALARAAAGDPDLDAFTEAAIDGRTSADRDVELTALAGAALVARAMAGAQVPDLTPWPVLAALSGFVAGGHATDLASWLASTDVPAGPIVAAHGAMALAALGRTGEATAVVDALTPTTPVADAIRWWATAEVADLAGRTTTCRAAARRCVEVAPDGFVVASLAALAEARAAVEAGETIVPPLPRVAVNGKLVDAVAAEHHALGLVTRPADAAAAFRDAASAWSGVHRIAELRCSFASAQASIAAGRRDEGVAELSQLDAVATDLDLRPLMARVRRALRAAGVRLVVEAQAKQGALSARERQVLTLVRDGLTSPEIAARLGVARSTVETQIKFAMQKLGARTRVQAAAMAAETP